MRAAARSGTWLRGHLERPSWVCEGPPLAPRKPRLLDTVRDALRVRHYGRRTEHAYLGWIRRYILSHGKRHPAEMGAAEVSRFLSALAVEGSVSASTQNQALAALLFLGEKVSPVRWAGVILIMIGAALISYSEHSKNKPLAMAPASDKAK